MSATRVERTAARPPADRNQLLRLARERFGIRRFRPGQLALIEAVLRGEDALGLLPTGAGKSLTYQLPALLLSGPVLVVSPLISLMQDQHEKLSELEIEAAKLNSTLGARDEREVAEAIREGELELIYVTPERLEKSECLALLKERGVALMVVDEAHCVSQWGHDFRPAYLGLRNAVRELGNPPLLALTATATPETIDDILQQLGIADAKVVQTSIERRNLFWRVERTPRADQKDELVAALLREQEGAGIIYVSTVRTATELHRKLCAQGVEAGLYHGKLSAKVRSETQRRFMADELKVMVATAAFGLGIDKPNLRFVVHYNFPDSLESYYQEAGRAGRDGGAAQVVLLYRLEDKRLHSYFLAGKYPQRDETRRIVEALFALTKSEPKRGVTVAQLAEQAQVTDKRARVVAAQLTGAEIAELRRGRLRPLRQLYDWEEMEQLLAAYEERRRDDHERLEDMMRYAQSASCRSAQIARYFGEEMNDGCDHCDNCQQQPQGVADEPPKLPEGDALERLVASAVGNVAVEEVVS